MKRVDLHLHSTFSDGVFTPTQLVQQALQAGIEVMALTDHDSCNGIREAQQAALQANTGLRVIPGIEMGSQVDKYSIHILGYGIDITNRDLLDNAQRLRHAREVRLEKILAKCAAQGMELQVEECDAVNRAVGRPHVAKAMIKKGYVQTVQEAFDKYLGRGKPCYEPQPKLTPKEAVALIQGAGGLAFLAHPEEIDNTSLVAEMLNSVKFDGLEVFHPSALKAKTTDYWLNQAIYYNLLISGGSDFHGHPDRFPTHLEDFVVKSRYIDKFLDVILTKLI